jgi:hypothetical protein
MKMPSTNVAGWAAAQPSVKGTGMFAGASFFPLVPNLEPGKYIVRDLTKGPAAEPLENLGVPHDVGRYNERRPAMYTTDLFGAADDPSSKRDIHMGIDIGGALSFASFRQRRRHGRNKHLSCPFMCAQAGLDCPSTLSTTVSCTVRAKPDFQSAVPL